MLTAAANGFVAAKEADTLAVVLTAAANGLEVVSAADVIALTEMFEARTTSTPPTTFRAENGSWENVKMPNMARFYVVGLCSGKVTTVSLQ